MKEIIPMSLKDFLIEQFFLALRTDQGIRDLTPFQDILVDNASTLLEQYTQAHLIQKKQQGFVLTDQGMDVYNQIVTKLLKEI